MHTKSAVLVLIMLATSTGFARDVDYGKVERKLVKEPSYRSKTPQYALLLFGRDAKIPVWVVLDGKTVYIDINSDGDLTDSGERFDDLESCKNIKIAGTGGHPDYLITSIGDYKDDDSDSRHLMANVDINGPLKYSQYCDARTHPDLEQAAIAHFDGPLTIGPTTINWKVFEGLSLPTEEKPARIGALIGTMSAKYKCWVVVRTHKGKDSAFPIGVVPTVEVEFPSKAGAAKIKQKFKLDGFC